MPKKRKKNNFTQTFTKVWVNRLLWFACIWITFSYVLAAIGMVTIAESLSSTACTTIIGVAVSYMLKAFFETNAEKKLEFEKEKYYTELNNATNAELPDEETPVG